MLQGEWDSSRRRIRLVSRRTVLTNGLGAALLGSGLAAGAATAAAKVPKAQAGYKDAARAAMRCDRCLQFQPPTSCKIVDGAISPSGSCDFFAPKPS
jgi:hypothetical protein